MQALVFEITKKLRLKTNKTAGGLAQSVNRWPVGCRADVASSVRGTGLILRD